MIATLIRQRTLKIIKKELEAKGVALGQVLPVELRALCEAYFESHRSEMIRFACDTVRIGAGLYQIAEREAHRRAMARAALSLAKGRDYEAMGSDRKNIRPYVGHGTERHN